MMVWSISLIKKLKTHLISSISPMLEMIFWTISMIRNQIQLHLPLLLQNTLSVLVHLLQCRSQLYHTQQECINREARTRQQLV